MVIDRDNFVSCWATDYERRTSNYPNIATPWGDKVDNVGTSSAWNAQVGIQNHSRRFGEGLRLIVAVSSLPGSLLRGTPEFAESSKVGGMSVLSNSRNSTR